MTTPPPYAAPPPGGIPPGGIPPAGNPPSNNLVWGILTTIFCCLPLGIVSIVKASQVNGLWAQGQFAAAQQAAEDAKRWAIWALIAGLVVFVLYIVLLAVGLATFGLSTSTP